MHDTIEMAYFMSSTRSLEGSGLVSQYAWPAEDSQGQARAARPQENGQENGAGVERALRRCLVPGVLGGRKTHRPRQYPPAVPHALAVAPPPATPA